MASRLAEEEADVALARLGGLDEREQQVVREMAERLVRRVLYPVSRTVREAGGNPEVAAGK
jgi:glutamyl-tRNA reductase